jgi:hypothetical protein
MSFLPRTLINIISKFTLHNSLTHTQALASDCNDWNKPTRLRCPWEPLHVVGLQRHMHYYHPSSNLMLLNNGLFPFILSYTHQHDTELEVSA